jgi:hypothetical protein
MTSLIMKKSELERWGVIKLFQCLIASMFHCLTEFWISVVLEQLLCNH